MSDLGTMAAPMESGSHYAQITYFFLVPRQEEVVVQLKTAMMYRSTKSLESVSVKAMVVLSISARFLFKGLVLTPGGPTTGMAASHFDSEL